ncbi:Asp-tRNA(Asn)/Glu-tRNA(Gln) amidotransferase subunit GatB [Wukongibacter baidiensis]|uniref:Asp-tRNA(Asn)/Glu-tRNA(Gln) amidotransferase subunit GatB n=1 Tax=Wukongibacter baidiensis TaxID=1723361 RepID=UPI003D7F59CD
MSYETIIGLEIHAELETKSKIFCSCSTKFGAKPNENTCPICTGIPGTLPMLNKEVVNLAIKAGVALNCEINALSKTDRKNYFYPDLPKAYQISQYDIPICKDGFVEIDMEDGTKKINITRIHIEEDAGKLIHLDDESFTLVDYNRAGVPLIEIVTEPDFRSAEEAVIFLKTLKSILKYIEVSDCRMEQGSLRCDANISIREIGQRGYNKKVEIKNLNSFKEVGKALKEEERRQKELFRCGDGHKIKQETRKWNAGKGTTLVMRSKEDAHDYKFFPEPDLMPIHIEKELAEEMRNTLPEFPNEKARRFIKEYGLNKKEVEILVSDKGLADYFERVVSLGCKPKDVSNWIIVEVLRSIKKEEVGQIKAEYLGKLIKLVNQGIVSRLVAKVVLRDIIETGKEPEEIIKEKGLSQISGEDALNEVINLVLSKNPKAVEDLKNGKSKALGFLVGQIMKETKGKANPALTKNMLIEKLKEI